MTLTEALPHLISAAAFNNSPSSPLINPMKSPVWSIYHVGEISDPRDET